MRQVALILLVACAHSPAGPRNEVLRPGRLVIFGEMHGTNEIPRFFGDQVEEAVRRGIPVHAGLELPGPEGAIWTAPYRDGRTSAAMAQLIGRLDALHVPIFWFDSRAPDRDGAMADAISAARARAPAHLYLVLVGNLHARKKPGAPWDPNVRWMAERLAAREPDLLTLDVRYPSGTAWICQSPQAPDCRETRLRGFPIGPERGIALEPQPQGYDGVYTLGPLTASPPAR